MKYKKGLIFICLIICLFSIASVCASDVNDTVVASEDQNGEAIAIENNNDVVTYDNQVYEDNVSVYEDVDKVGATEENELSATTGSFTDLANDIANAGNEFKLTKNYVFSSKDSNYKFGVTISKKITIDGNGFTIDGNNIARVFKIKSDGVIFKNINFINCFREYDYDDEGYAGNGGAIEWFGKNGVVSDCSFVNCNVESDGGAIFLDEKSDNVNIYHCSFKNCFAGSRGAAIRWDSNHGIISDCSFINCSNATGAIIWYGENGNISNCNFFNCSYCAISCVGGNTFVSHCNFNECKGLGGGISMSDRGTISNCNFIQCSSNGNGGAISIHGTNSVTISNCNFIQCSSNGNGGAICTYLKKPVTISNCNFIECSAKNGGAIYNEENYFTVQNSNFTNNKASENGGALYGGKEYNCLFNNNVAAIKGINAYLTEVSKSTLNISNFQPVYEYGSKLTFDFRTILGLQIKYATITINVFKDGTLVGTYKTLSSKDWIVNLGEGSYELILSVDNQDYYVNSVNTILNVVKIATKITSSPIITTYNIDRELIITLKNKNDLPLSNEMMFVDFNGLKILFTDSNGQIKLSTQNLIPKSYVISIMFPGNDYYYDSTQNILVTVKKATPKITAKKKTFKKSVKTKKYIVTLKTNQNKVMKKTKVTLKVNKKTYTAKTNSKGKATFKITKLTKKGTFKATVTYKGNANYNKVTKKVNIKIK